MARQRRGGGFRPPELRGTLGTLLRTTLAQAGTLRDALERGAREGRSRLDSALSNRRRHDALAELGDIVLDLIRRGEIDVDELPEVRDIVAHLDDIDAGTYDETDTHGHGHSHGHDHGHDEPEYDEPSATPPVRNRFDARRPASPAPSPSSRSDRRRPAPSRATAARNPDRDRDSAEDGTVSSRTWTRPASAPAARPPKPAPRVWRPPADEITPPSTPAALRSADEITRPGVPTPRKDPSRKGGIHFDDDEDLSEYMHPDDVPPKTPQGGE